MDEPIKEPELTPEEKPLRDFMSQITVGQDYIKTIKTINQRLQLIKNELSNPNRENEISIEVDKLIDAGTIQQKKTKMLLDQINMVFITECKKNDPKDSNRPETRIIHNIYGSTIKSFEDVIFDFQNVQGDIKTIKQSLSLRNAQIVMGRELNENEKVNVLENPKIVQEMMKSRLGETAHVKLENAVSDLEERHKEIMKIERSVQSIHELFIELQTLVKLQGNVIDNIEQNVKCAKGLILEGEQDIIKSVDHMKSARRKKCLILIAVLVIILVIVAPILITKL